jgi:ADP-ribosylglycohydrolase
LEPWPDDVRAMIHFWPRATLSRVRGQARDDDIDYTLLGLELLEAKGTRFGADDVAAQILNRLPFTQVYTAERVAYRSAANGLQPPHTATYRNPYPQWIGALIRVDVLGYVCPGDAGQAVQMAYRNAVFSHTANGIYAAMWGAALIASCFVATSMAEAPSAAMVYIPQSSRLAEELRFVTTRHAAGDSWETAIDAAQARLTDLSWVHAVSNAAVIAAGLLWGDGDFVRTVGLTVQAGWDTDSNGATAGSAFGAMHGARALPAHMIDPLENRVDSAIAELAGARISELADRTYRLVAKVDESTDKRC